MWDAALPPLVAERWQAFQQELGAGDLDPALLERCRRRICELLGDEAGLATGGEPPPATTDVERLALEVAEVLAIDVHAVGDDQVDALRRELGEGGTVGLLCALGVYEATSRARVALGRS